jgi:hypothetical protein
MLRVGRVLRVPEWQYPATKFPRRIGYYVEDHSCDWDTQVYTHPQVMREWYTRQERHAALTWSETQRAAESANYNSGLHFSGDGPFEREMRRKGVQVEKYKLPSTLGVRRVHEMVALRRRELEQRAAQSMAAARERVRTARPSWLDEADGPVNPHFLAMTMGRNYEQFELPRTPVLRAAVAGS